MWFYPEDQDIPELSAIMKERKMISLHVSVNEDAIVTRQEAAKAMADSLLFQELNPELVNKIVGECSVYGRFVLEGESFLKHIHNPLAWAKRYFKDRRIHRLRRALKAQAERS